jgi:hypothetical protein
MLVPKPLPATLADRFAAAWKAFKQNTNEDPEELKKYLAEKAAERGGRIDCVIGKLAADAREYISKVELGGATGPQVGGLNQFLLCIDGLPQAEQALLVKHLLSCDARLALRPQLRDWMGQNSAFVANLMKAHGSLDAALMLELKS